MGPAGVVQPVVPAIFSPDAGLSLSGAREAGSVTLYSEVEVATRSATPCPTTTNDNTLPRAWQTSVPAVAAPSPCLLHPQSFRMEQNATRGTADSHPLLPSDALPPAVEPATRLAPEGQMISHRDDVRGESSQRATARSEVADLTIHDGEPGKTIAPVDATQVVPARHSLATQLRVAPSLPAHGRSTLRRDRVEGPTAEPPVVRVTIGRIDVRAQFAAPAASPTPARRARPGALTVEEYLKQRSEGKR